MTIQQLTEGLLSGFVLGLSTGPLCMGSCLPLLLPFSFSGVSSGTDKHFMPKFFGKFLAGRFIAYLMVGMGIGYMGTIFKSAVINRATLIIMIILAVILIAYGLGVKRSHHGLCQTAHRFSNSKKFPFILGVLTGVNVCAPFLLAILYSFERSTTPLFSGVFFMSFFFSTSLYLFPVILVKYLPRGEYLKKLSNVTAIFAGVYFLYRGITML